MILRKLYIYRNASQTTFQTMVESRRAVDEVSILLKPWELVSPNVGTKMLGMPLEVSLILVIHCLMNLEARMSSFPP